MRLVRRRDFTLILNSDCLGLLAGQPPVIAISYRREDSLPIAGRLYDRLLAEFGKTDVFMDFDSIPYGMDFRTHIKKTLERADVVLAVIGPSWTGPQSNSTRRIDDPKDFVRLEIAATLERGIPLIPVLVNDTPMPKPEALPMEIEGLAFRNALALDSGIDFHHHTDRLIASIRQLLDKAPNSDRPKYQKEQERRRPTLSPIALGLVLTGIALAVIAYFGVVMMRSGSPLTQKENPPATVAPVTPPSIPSPTASLSVQPVMPPPAPSPSAPVVPSQTDEDRVRELIRGYYLAFSRHDVDAVVANFADIVDYQGEGLRNRQHIRAEAEAYSRRWDTLSFSVGDISVSRTGDSDFAASFSFSYTVTTRGSSPVTGLSVNKWMLHKDSQGQLRIVFQRETIQQVRQSPGDKRKAKP